MNERGQQLVDQNGRANARVENSLVVKAMTNSTSNAAHTSDLTADISELVNRAVANKAKSYDYPWLRRGYMMQFLEIERATVETVSKCTGGTLKERKILDIGCGAGGWIREFVKWGARPEDIYGIDAMASRIAAAREGNAPGVNLICGNAERLEFADETFDLIMLYQSMTLMLEDAPRRRVAAEALRVLKPGGAVLWYDYRYQRPDMKGVLRSTGKHEIKRLFPGCEYRLKSIHPFPPISRRLAGFWMPAWYLLGIFPPLRTCYAGAIIKPR